MPLLRPKKRSAKARFRAFTVICCPLNGHQVGWCHRLCTPLDGHGLCGRLAPHAMISRTQAAIAAAKAGADTPR
jgi:hypothetical protein